MGRRGESDIFESGDGAETAGAGGVVCEWQEFCKRWEGIIRSGLKNIGLNCRVLYDRIDWLALNVLAGG